MHAEPVAALIRRKADGYREQEGLCHGRALEH
jgi:hypothetical protein